jgi:hypothetical protein
MSLRRSLQSTPGGVGKAVTTTITQPIPVSAVTHSDYSLHDFLLSEVLFYAYAAESEVPSHLGGVIQAVIQALSPRVIGEH